MSEHSVEEKPCPRCKQSGRDIPNPRAVTSGGKMLGYCRPCLAEYQSRRNRDLTLIGNREKIRAGKNVAKKQELEEAVQRLVSAKPGRPAGDRVCPRCESEERAPGQGYCKPCGNAYRKERRERLRAEHVQEMNEELDEPTPEGPPQQSRHQFSELSDEEIELLNRFRMEK